jgi:CRP-like cAMP-binding protein
MYYLLCEQPEPGDQFNGQLYIVESGYFNLYYYEELQGKVEPGGIIGEISFLNGTVRNNKAQASKQHKVSRAYVLRRKGSFKLFFSRVWCRL